MRVALCCLFLLLGVVVALAVFHPAAIKNASAQYQILVPPLISNRV